MSCPGCGVESVRVHSRYQRRVKDCAVGGQPVVVELTVRRLFCDQDSCPRRTFVEQVDGLTVRYGRYTPGLRFSQDFRERVTIRHGSSADDAFAEER
ncbi:transposase family protein [Streptomyces sp. H27-C3]|uniref:transposase family protein n=1 Tax=Streptomyces sp. H27-C3 TaxID=3046305 RepID=UPI0024BA4A69|nr:transposase family protein [Streptomyces sp. H27-C3]MDJ0465975.1 transposase family protein [Streptomyces sp. H27-C3]